MIRMKCPRCETALRMDDSKAGAVIVCPRCSVKLRVPRPKPPEPDGEAEEDPRPARKPAAASAEAVTAGKPAKVPPPEADEPDGGAGEEEAARPAARRLPRFDTEPYRPAGGFNVAGLAILLGIMLPVAVLLGFLASLIGQWFYLIIIFPAGICLGLAMAGMGGVKVGKVANPALSIVAGLIAATVAVLAMHYFDYQRDMARAREELAKVQPNMAGAAVEGPGLFGYIDAKARAGVTLTGKHGKMNLGYVGSYIYFFVEYLFLAALLCFLMYGFAREPFCKECKSWKAERQLGVLTLPVEDKPKEAVDYAVATLKKGKLAGLVNEDPDAEQVELGLSAYVCPNCEDAPVEVKMRSIERNEKGEVTNVDLALVTYPAEAVAVLESLCERVEEKEEPEEEPEEEEPAPEKRTRGKARRARDDDG